MDWSLKQTEHGYEPLCKKRYELNIEVHECNEPYVSLPPATDTQPIELFIGQVGRGCSYQQLCLFSHKVCS